MEKSIDFDRILSSVGGGKEQGVVRKIGYTTDGTMDIKVRNYKLGTMLHRSIENLKKNLGKDHFLFDLLKKHNVSEAEGLWFDRIRRRITCDNKNGAVIWEENK